MLAQTLEVRHQPVRPDASGDESGGGYHVRGPIVHYLTGASVWLFGSTEFAFRLPALIFNLLSIPLAYLCTRRFVSVPVATALGDHPPQRIRCHVQRFVPGHGDERLDAAFVPSLLPGMRAAGNLPREQRLADGEDWV